MAFSSWRSSSIAYFSSVIAILGSDLRAESAEQSNRRAAKQQSKQLSAGAMFVTLGADAHADNSAFMTVEIAAGFKVVP